LFKRKRTSRSKEQGVNQLGKTNKKISRPRPSKANPALGGLNKLGDNKTPKKRITKGCTIKRKRYFSTSN